MFGIHTGLKNHQSKVGYHKPASQGTAQARLGKVGQESSKDSGADSVSLSAEAKAAQPRFGVPNPFPSPTPLPGQSSDQDRPPLGEATVEFAERMNDTRGVLRDNFSDIAGGDGRISRDDLVRALGEEGEVGEAASFLLRNSAVRNLFDTGAGRGDVDGSISERDLIGLRVRESNPFEDGDLDEARETLSDRFFGLADTAAGRGGANGNVSNEDIDALRDNPDIPFELIEALNQYAF